MPVRQVIHTSSRDKMYRFWTTPTTYRIIYRIQSWMQNASCTPACICTRRCLAQSGSLHARSGARSAQQPVSQQRPNNQRPVPRNISFALSRDRHPRQRYDHAVLVGLLWYIHTGRQRTFRIIKSTSVRNTQYTAGEMKAIGFDPLPSSAGYRDVGGQASFGL